MHRRAAAVALGLGVGLVAVAACTKPPPRESSAFCDQLRALQQVDPLQAANTDGDAVKAGEATFDSLASAAPYELKAPLRTLRRAVGDLSGLDPSSQASADKAVKIVSNPQVVSAAQSVRDYGQQVCGIDGLLGGPGRDGSDASTPDTSTPDTSAPDASTPAPSDQSPSTTG